MLGMSIIVKTNEDLQESYRDICNGDIKLTFTCIVIGTFGDVGSIIKLSDYVSDYVSDSISDGGARPDAGGTKYKDNAKVKSTGSGSVLKSLANIHGVIC